MARRRKPGRPKGSKNKKRSKAKTKSKSGRRKRKATPAQMRALKKAWAARRKQGKAAKKTAKKTGKKMTAKRRAQLAENLKKARAARELKNMPKTRRMALKQLEADLMAETVRAPMARHPNPHVAALYSKRRRADTLVSAT